MSGQKSKFCRGVVYRKSLRKWLQEILTTFKTCMVDFFLLRMVVNTYCVYELGSYFLFHLKLFAIYVYTVLYFLLFCVM